jgi:nucleoside 2-deoxyribosyltransferase
MEKQVFISGPILGMENNQDYYRNFITSVSEKLGFAVIDPWKREKYLYSGKELDGCSSGDCGKYAFVERDLADADKCDLMVVYLPKLSAGACMELFYAKRRGKTVIVVSDMEQLSPWIKFHCDIIINSLDKLEETLAGFK